MPSLSECPIEGCRCREPKGVGASIVKSKCFIAPIGSCKVIHFYSPKESSLSIVGPLGLRGSLFLGLLVFDFFPPTNRGLYFVYGGGGVAWVGGRIILKNFYVFKKRFHFSFCFKQL